MADLILHPGLMRHTRGYSTEELSILNERGECAYAEPLTINDETLILEGYALWQLARLQKRATLPCIMRRMAQEESLLYILHKNRGSKGMSDYPRIQIALELELWLRELARANQSGCSDQALHRLLI